MSGEPARGQSNDDGDGDVALLRYALGLEIEAVARYAEHAAGTSDPRFALYWESLRRNESDHRDALLRRLEARGGGPQAGGAPAAVEHIAVADPASLPACPEVAGFRSIATALAADLVFEHGAVRIYGAAAAGANDPSVKELFRELARGEAGHARGLRTWLQRLAGGELPVLFFCPLCGWELDLGVDPAEGATVKCPMCPGRFALRLRRGDWLLDRVRT
jgi:rubrerythrin